MDQWNKFREASAKTIDADPLGPDRHGSFRDPSTEDIGSMPTANLKSGIEKFHQQKIEAENDFEAKYRETHGQ